MIVLNEDQQKKIELLDKLFGALSIEQLKDFSESEEIVSKLRGDNNSPGIIRRLVDENSRLELDLNIAKGDLYTLKMDFQSLLKSLNQTVFSPVFNSDFDNLKSRHCVY